ncbi:hypothetical protein AB0D10_01255 [Kitasatospora sp. NPDC048545]|uniref:hypothetical protein n=1 Tax=Kitasatospora sp. NPDC048545 TaxID=3157208 RepID=UPI0033CA263E
MNTPHPHTEQAMQALLITEDGTTTPVTLPAALPAGHAARLAIAQYLGGPARLGHCTAICSPDAHLATVGLLEDPPAGTPRNEYAEVVVEVLRHASPKQAIHGPVLIMGPAADGTPTSLDPGQQRAVEDFVATWRTLVS